MRNPPELICTAESGGRRDRIAYNLATKVATIRADEGPAGRLSTRRFLTGLHLAFGYPSTFDARWYWAVFVDAMAAAMVLWGLSGLAMWWQMRSQRRWGLAALLVSIATATGLGRAMYSWLAL